MMRGHAPLKIACNLLTRGALRKNGFERSISQYEHHPSYRAQRCAGDLPPETRQGVRVDRRANRLKSPVIY